ncbi:flippase [Flavobacterium sp. ST-75]|uniref:Flippase n=1 Tax=Flavobacterium rhizophilum TaxID=3163296 RepID=A0ABW8YEW8_9FLAO
MISTSGIGFIFRLFGLGTSFLATMLISRLFSVGVFGNYSLAFTIAQATALVFALGIPSALVKIVGNNSYTYLQAKKLLIKGLKITLVFSIVPVMFFFFGAGFLSETIFKSDVLSNYFVVICLVLPLFIFHELFLFFFISVKKFKLYNVFMFGLPNLLLLAFLYLFYILKMPEHYTFIAFAISMLIVVITEAFMVFEIKPKTVDTPLSSGALVKTAWPLLFSGLMLYLLNWTDLIMLGMMVDEDEVGIYNIAYKIGTLGFLVIVTVNIIMMPKMAELYGKGDLSGLKKFIHKSTRLIIFTTVPIVAGIVGLSSYILSFFGEEAIAGKSTLIIISAGILFSAMCGNTDQILNMTGNEKVFRNITVVCFLANISLNYLLIPVYGINGAAIASVATNALLNVISLFYMKKMLGFYTFA